jgi:hypothetical protein
MTQQTHRPQAASNEFDAAKTIVETLKRLDKHQQERAIRFASETLGLHQATQRPHEIAMGAPGQASDARAVTSGAGRAIDIKQFTDSKAPKSDQQFAAVVAHYYRFDAPPEERRETINVQVLADAARRAGRKRPGRLTLNNAKNQGYFDSVGRGEFKLNTVGENLVAITLPGNTGEGEKKRTRNRRVKKRGTKATNNRRAKATK